MKTRWHHSRPRKRLAPYAIFEILSQLLPTVAASTVLLLATNFVPATANAAVPALQVTPLQYSGTLHAGHISQGFVDVANPTDTTVDIQTGVKGWRQTGYSGDLEFFDNADLNTGIKVDLTDFTLGPREAIRMAFTADPSKLPRGGVYAAIFFRTQPPAQSANSSYVVQSANVGTLLILNNGSSSTNLGTIGLALPFWQFGSGISGSLNFTNANRSSGATAVKPALTARVLPWGHATAGPSGLVLPGYTRHFEISRSGAYFGLLPVTMSDSVTHAHRTGWVLATTGVYRLLIPIIILIVLIVLTANNRRQHIDN